MNVKGGDIHLATTSSPQIPSLQGQDKRPMNIPEPTRLNKVVQENGTEWKIEYGNDMRNDPYLIIHGPKISYRKYCDNGEIFVNYYNGEEAHDTIDTIYNDIKRKLFQAQPEYEFLEGTDEGRKIINKEIREDMEKLNPVMEFPDRKVSWDAKTRLLKQDGHWTYDIKASPGLGNSAAISRVNMDNGDKEYWFRDDIKGKEITEQNGHTTIRTWFTSGLLRRKTRSEVRIVDGVEKFRKEYSYNEKGELIRNRTLWDGGCDDTFYVYEEDGKLAASITNGIPTIYTKNGAKLAEKYVKDKEKK
jgi:hypothetical protein